MGTLRRLRLDPVWITFVVLLLVWGFSLLRVEGYRSLDFNLFTLRVAAFLGIGAAGQTLVVLMGGIDLSVAAVDARGHESLYAYSEYRCDASNNCSRPSDALNVTATR